MRFFFRCVAEAVCEHGMKGLAEMVPGGKFAYDVAEGVWKKYKERRKEGEQREELAKLAQVTLEEAKAEAAVVAREVATAAADDIIDLELYLTAIPDAVRQSLKRPEDPTGTTVPATFALKSADDVLKLLPPRPPRFRPGAALPGMSGWVLDRLLGTGGFGEVWYARHVRMGSLGGAVKFCFGQSGQDLIHEAETIDRIMAAGKHPNIVPLTHAHLEGDCPWLMFEYVGGGTLADWIHWTAAKPKEQRLNQVQVALSQLCEGVAFFHSMPVPVVHRDLKPSNILLDRATKKLRITDFGIGSVTARETNRQESRGGGTRGGRLLTYLRGSHTPLYSSPQQRSGADPDPRDDVHALGVIAYQMLTGHLAQGAGPDFADDLRDAGTNEELISLLGRCVAQKPERRPKDARELMTHVRPVPPPKPPPAPEVDESRQLAEELHEYEQLVSLGKDTASVLKARAPKRLGAWLAAANAGNASAMALVGELFTSGIGVTEDPKEGARWLRKAAEVENPTGMYALASAYNWGQGLRKNYRESVNWLRKAAEAGVVVAMYDLGCCLANGDSVEQDHVEALRWFHKAADLGHAPAINDVGVAYDSGEGVEQDHVQAVQWFRRAAELGSADAMYNMGDAFTEGKGVGQDSGEALSWYRRAADVGDTDAMTVLGNAYDEGKGVAKDHAEAVRWYRKAAELEDSVGMFNLGYAYEHGAGVPANKKQAVEWYRKAAELGLKEAKAALKQLGVTV